jgi:hypothetical protein
MAELLTRMAQLNARIASHPQVVIRDGEPTIPAMDHRQRKYGLNALAEMGLAVDAALEDLVDLTQQDGLWWQGLEDGKVVVAGEWSLMSPRHF